MTLWIGLGVVVVSALALVPMMFTGRPEPATLDAMTQREHAAAPRRRADRPLPTPTIRVPERVSLRPSWAERLRGGIGLVVVVAGLAATLALVLGLAVLVVGRLLN